MAKMWRPEQQVLLLASSGRRRGRARQGSDRRLSLLLRHGSLGAGFESAWSSIVDPKQFWTPWPVASASRECPAYSQTNWPGDGRAATCMWNGPTWPHANSLVLTAMARTLRADPRPPRRRFPAPAATSLAALLFVHEGPVPRPGHALSLDRRVL